LLWWLVCHYEKEEGDNECFLNRKRIEERKSEKKKEKV
jgi:hypothetical protein